MAIRDIDYLKSRFQNGDEPDQYDFGDWLDTMFSKPIVIEFSGNIVVDANDPKSNLNFEVDISSSASFSTMLVRAKTLTTPSGWEYWNGISMQPMTSNGLAPTYQDSDIGMVTYTWSGGVAGSTYYARYRSGFGDVWGDYRIRKIVT